MPTRRRLQTILCGVTLMSLASLYLSYSKLLRSVELAAAAADLVEVEAAAG